MCAQANQQKRLASVLVKNHPYSEMECFIKTQMSLSFV